MKKILLALPVLVLTFACSSSRYTDVYMQTGNMKFVGETADAHGNSGDFILTSPNGVTCEGSFDYTNTLSGKGTIACSDKRSGTFVFTSKKDLENDQIQFVKGYGQFKNGAKFVISFGKEVPVDSFSLQGNEKQIPSDMAVQSTGRRPDNTINGQDAYTGSTPAYKGQFDIDI